MVYVLVLYIASGVGRLWVASIDGEGTPAYRQVLVGSRVVGTVIEASDI